MCFNAHLMLATASRLSSCSSSCSGGDLQRVTVQRLSPAINTWRCVVLWATFWAITQPLFDLQQAAGASLSDLWLGGASTQSSTLERHLSLSPPLSLTHPLLRGNVSDFEKHFANGFAAFRFCGFTLSPILNVTGHVADDFSHPKTTWNAIAKQKDLPTL